MPVRSVSRAAVPAFPLQPTALHAALAALLLAGGLAAPIQAHAAGAWWAVQGAARESVSGAAGLNAARLKRAQGASTQSANQRLAAEQAERMVANAGRTAQVIAAEMARQQRERDRLLAGPSSIPEGVAPGGLQQDLAAGWEGAEQALRIRQEQGRTEVAIRQDKAKAILNWKTFNVGRNTTVHFDQSAGTDARTGRNDWAVLNRITDPSGKPSEIAGQIKAEGSVYLINRNGIIFTGTSQINTRSLVASSLKLTDEQFRAGLNVRLGANTGDPGYWSGLEIAVGIPTFGENPTNLPADSLVQFADMGPAFDPGAAPGDVKVQAGAQIKAQGGHVLLFAPKVSNAGSIRTPDGQTLMAAGENVWLEAKADDPSVRGFDAVVSSVRPWAFPARFLVEPRTDPAFQQYLIGRIVSDIMPRMEQRAAEVGYSVLNTGIVQADHGDITLVSREINQNGVLQASTALNNRAGSIRLRAWGQGVYNIDNNLAASASHLVAWSGGALTLGPDSITQVVNDWQDATQIESSALANRYQPGRIELYGKSIDVQARAQVTAAAGEIDIQAQANPAALLRHLQFGDGSRILVGENATISTAGLLEMPVDMASNFVEAELRINELRDSHQQSGTWLYGRKVIVDRRKSGTLDGLMGGVEWVTDDSGKVVKGAWIGTPLADVTGWVGNGLVTLSELAARGGSITIQSNGSMITRPGSILDVSGGSVRYSDGWNTETLLRGADGRLYPMSSAPADMIYVGIAGQYQATHARWGVTRTFLNPVLPARRWERGYAEGREAGSIEILAGSAFILEGEMKGSVQPGDRAQELSDLPQAGRLLIGSNRAQEGLWTLGKVIIGNTPTLLPEDFTIDSPLGKDAFLTEEEGQSAGTAAGAGRTTWLSAASLSHSGMGSIELNLTAGFNLEEGTVVNLTPGARFVAQVYDGSGNPGDFDIQGSLIAPGGSITLSAGGVADSVLRLGANSVLSTAGQWINDTASGGATLGRAIHGGSIVLGTPVKEGLGTVYGKVDVAAGAVVDVSGGGWLPDAGPDGRGGKMRAGNGGIASLMAFDSAALDTLDLRGWSGGNASRLSIMATSDVQLGGAAPGGEAVPGAPETLHLPETLFSERGFGTISVRSLGGDVVVAQGAQVRVLPTGWDMSAPLALRGLPSGQSLGSVLGPVALDALPGDVRAARAPGGLSLTTGVSGGSIRIDAGSLMQVEPGGSVSLDAGGSGQATIAGRIVAPAGTLDIRAVTSLTLAEGAELLLPGVAQVFYDPVTQLQRGKVLAGGTVSLTAGSLDARAGSSIDVSGASGTVQYWARDAGVLGPNRRAAQELGSDGGAVAVTVSAGGAFNATLRAHGGNALAAGGSLSIVDTSSAGSPSGDLVTPDIGSFLFYRTPAGMTGTHTFDGVQYTRVIGTSANLDVFDEYVGDVRMASAMRTAINGTLPTLVSSSNGMVIDAGAASASGSGQGMAAWEYNTSIDPRVVELLNKYFWSGTGTALSHKINIGRIATSDSTLHVSAASLQNTGISALSLQSTQVGVQVSGGVDLNVEGRLRITAPVIKSDGKGGTARLHAHALQLRPLAGTVGAAAVNAGELILSASQVLDIAGGSVKGDASQSVNVNLRGFERTVLETGDLRFVAGLYSEGGTDYDDANLRATLDVDGALEIRAAQVYPGTAVTARIVSGQSIAVRGNGSAEAPLSAGGSLTLSAPVIEQTGVLRAPFGQIVLEASDRLVLGDASLTSVSGAGLGVLYGTLRNAEYWLDPSNPQGRSRTNPNDAGVLDENRYLSSLPEKRVSLQAPDVSMAAGAVVDIAGGGELYAWEHVPGSGGSHDALTLPGMYAVLPRYGGLSPEVAAGGDAAGRKVWLAGGGLEAGWYTLLPARYALLPGAFAVQATGQAMPAGAVSSAEVARLRDGSVLVAGRVQDAISGAQDAASSVWRVSSGDLVRKVSEFNEARGNAFFASDAFKLTQYRLTGQDVVTPRLPRDGGAVVFKAASSLVLDGQLRAQPDEGGRGSLVDISADRIAIVGAGQDGSDLRAAGYLVVDAGSLTRFGAGSLLVGGTRTGDAQGLQVDVAASDVVLRNTADSALSGPEVILAATNLVSIESGSVLRADGQASGEDTALVLKPQAAAQWNNNNTPNDTNDDYIVTPSKDWGALVRVSSGTAVRALRQNVDTTTGGQVRIGAGARLDGGAALLIDATNTTEMAAGAQVSGTALSVAAGRIGIGGGSAGLVLDADALAQLSRTQALTLHSYGSLDFYRALDMRDLAQVVLDAAALHGAGADAVQVQATRLTLQNTGAQAAGAGVGSGRLELMADELVLGAGNKSISGFGQVLLTGRQRIVGEGSGGLDAGAAALTLSAPVLQGGAGADQTLRTQGQLVLQRTADMDAAAITALGARSLGARLSLSGQGVTIALPVLALGGSVSVDAGTGDLTVTEQGSLRVGGLEQVFFDVPQYVDAGQIGLATRGGLIDLAPGSLLDLSAHENGGDAGNLTVDASAGGRVNFGGTLQARAVTGSGNGGRFALAIDQLADFGSLAQMLNQTGFSQSRQFRIREGDLTISGATQVADFEVITDRGSITVDGTAHVDASATYGGSIRLVGGGGLAMQEGAVLAARATDATDGVGSGRITLEAVNGNLQLAGGTLDLSGGEGGRLRLRAQRNAGNDGVNVTALNASVQGARFAVLEGVRSYASTDGTVESVKALAIDQANAFAGNASILSGLGGNAGAYSLAAGIEITSAGNLTLGSDWNLNGDFGAAHREGTLTLRAAGNLNLDGHLSDGFDAADRQGRLSTAASWNLRLVAGADLASVDALAMQSLGALAADAGTLRVGTADVTPGSGGAGKLVRTGTGDLTVRAGRDVILAHKESVLYTAGRAEADPTLGGGFSTASSGAQYGADGGHVDIAAQGSVQAPIVQGARSDQILTEWLFRQGRYGGDVSSPSGYYDAYQVGNPWDIPPTMSAQGQQPSWWVNYASFEQGLGALGGGNVRLSAGGDLVNLVVAVPSTMRVTGGRAASDAAAAIVSRNGGQLRVTAGGTLKAGQYYVGRGAGYIEAGASGAGYTLTGTANTWPFTAYRYDIAPVLALSDATLTLKTLGDLVVQTVVDPMEIRRAYVDQADRDVSGSASHGLFMSSYTERSALKLVSTGGNVRLENQSEFVAGNNTGNTTQLVSGVTDTKLQSDRLGLYPAKVSVSALGGNIEVGGLLAMAPAATSDLSLLAAQDLRFLRGNGPLSTGAIVMSQATLEKWPSILTSWNGLTTMLSGGSAFGTPLKGPYLSNTFLTNVLNGSVFDNPDTLPMQRYDFAPSRLYAASGSITDLNLIASESVRVQAGTDIRNVELSGRNLRATDTTVLAAGNDILAIENRLLSHPYTPYGGSAQTYYYDRGSRATLQGPGELLLLAGRDIQGNNLSLYSNANRYWDYVGAMPRVEQPNVIKALPETGANITLMAGMNAAPSYAIFEQAYLDPANVAAMPAYLKTTLADGTEVPLYLTDGVELRGDLNKLGRRGLVSFMEGMLGADTVASLTGSEDGKLTEQQAWEHYQRLPALVRQQFLRQVFLYELRQGGRDQNDVDARNAPSNGGYRRGYAAIDTLFRGAAAEDQPVRYAQDLPDDWRGSWTGSGNVALTRLAARTHQGGDINVFTPGGGLQAAALGAAVPDGYGLVTLASPGQINVYADRDIIVNRSRILSFVSQAEPLGSDQVLWSTRGDIDAGRGAKTVRVPQAPTVSADLDGNITVEEKRDMSGAGIGTVGEGDVDLVAPGGTVNAGDAGIRVAGNFNVAALRVLNAANIQVEGESKGVPVAVSVNTGALTSASAAASSAATAAQDSVSRARDRTRQALPSIVTVQVLGFGMDGAAAPGAQPPAGRAPVRQGAPSGSPVSYRPESAIQVLGDGELPASQRARLQEGGSR
ncbi:Heme:hemopexin utilization protein A [Bordetella ansorpii]|uniref:Heme:hemopexin utilization protein A n=1 Tax=Bordetella ansorpii TaxID=288768 RepID=A0A157PV70_9BORD|nr:filamentous haemagglutinin family protein [Bordetella ansorpii]SAI37288.1 Heme:hemopexin utilization protein A [Bordetella ansorpii]